MSGYRFGFDLECDPFYIHTLQRVTALFGAAEEVSTIRFYAGDQSNVGEGICMNVDTTPNWWIQRCGSDPEYLIYVDGQSGYVGIGTNRTAAALTVSGDLFVDGQLVQKGSNSVLVTQTVVVSSSLAVEEIVSCNVNQIISFGNNSLTNINTITASNIRLYDSLAISHSLYASNIESTYLAISNAEVFDTLRVDRFLFGSNVNVSNNLYTQGYAFASNAEVFDTLRVDRFLFGSNVNISNNLYTQGYAFASNAEVFDTLRVDRFLIASNIFANDNIVSGNTLQASNLDISGKLQTFDGTTCNLQQLVIDNCSGPSPALKVIQCNSNEPIAEFYSGSNLIFSVTSTGVNAAGLGFGTSNAQATLNIVDMVVQDKPVFQYQTGVQNIQNSANVLVTNADTQQFGEIITWDGYNVTENTILEVSGHFYLSGSNGFNMHYYFHAFLKCYDATSPYPSLDTIISSSTYYNTELSAAPPELRLERVTNKSAYLYIEWDVATTNYLSSLRLDLFGGDALGSVQLHPMLRSVTPSQPVPSIEYINTSSVSSDPYLQNYFQILSEPMVHYMAGNLMRYNMLHSKIPVLVPGRIQYGFVYSWDASAVTKDQFFTISGKLFLSGTDARLFYEFDACIDPSDKKIEFCNDIVSYRNEYITEGPVLKAEVLSDTSIFVYAEWVTNVFGYYVHSRTEVIASRSIGNLGAYPVIKWIQSPSSTLTVYQNPTYMYSTVNGPLLAKSGALLIEGTLTNYIEGTQRITGGSGYESFTNAGPHKAGYEIAWANVATTDAEVLDIEFFVSSLNVSGGFYQRFGIMIAAKDDGVSNPGLQSIGTNLSISSEERPTIEVQRISASSVRVYTSWSSSESDYRVQSKYNIMTPISLGYITVTPIQM